jgi:ubiquinone biosynthesis protein
MTPLAYMMRSLVAAIATAVFLPSFAVVRVVAPAAAPRYLRWFLQLLGGGFAKLGQMLAMRFDLLPPAYYEELRQILDRLPRVSVRAIRRTIAEDLGRPVADVFEQFDDTPIGSASIAQAHRAVLPGGHRVVVKVMRPRIRAVLGADLANLELIARLLQLIGVFRNSDLGRIIREIKRYTLEELDFRREAFHAQALHDLMNADDIDHYAPHPYFDACGPRVLTLEELSGVWLSDLVTAIDRGDRAKLAAWAAVGVTPHRVARVLNRSTLEQAYRHRMFHADPHAGNVVILRGGTVAYIDFGIIGELDEDLRLKQERLVFHLVNGELHAAYLMLLAAIEVDGRGNLEELEIAVKAEFSEYLLRIRSGHALPAEKSVGRVFIAVARAIRRLDLRLPAKLTRFYRAQIIVDMLVFKLFPALDPIAELTEFWNDEGHRRLRDLTRGLHPAQLGNTLLAIPRALRALTDFLQFQVPRITDEARNTLTTFERGLLLALGYLRSGLLLAALGVVVIHFWPRRLAIGVIGGTWRVDDYWIPWTAGLLLVGYGVGRMAQQLRRFE